MSVHDFHDKPWMEILGQCANIYVGYCGSSIGQPSSDPIFVASSILLFGLGGGGRRCEPSMKRRFGGS
jgi:hypothetical protein